MKVWISRYALTIGIYEIDAEICKDVSNDMIENINKRNDYYHGEGKQWHRTKEDAIKKANEMKNKKITSLQKQITKLNKLTFLN